MTDLFSEELGARAVEPVQIFDHGHLWRPCLTDAKGDMVLALAVAAQVPRIVSFNAKDFGPASRFGIEVVSPKIVLEKLP